MKPKKEFPEVSSRTEYRKKRVQLIKECIALLIEMLTWSKQDQEKIHLPFFKKLKRSIEIQHFEENRD